MQTAKLQETLYNCSVNYTMNNRMPPTFFLEKSGAFGLYGVAFWAVIAVWSGVSGSLLFQTVEEICFCLIADLAVFAVQVQVEHVAV